MKEIADDYHSQLEPVLLFRPDTVLRWHCEWVRRKWTFKRKPSVGRPKISPELAALVLQVALDVRADRFGEQWVLVQSEQLKAPRWLHHTFVKATTAAADTSAAV